MPVTRLGQPDPALADKTTQWLEWMATHLRVVDKAGEEVAFVPNRIQADILGHMFAQWRRGYPVRLIILKPRQIGTSTVIQALFYTICHHTPTMKAVVVAHDTKGSDKVFQKAKFFNNKNPEKKRMSRDNAGELQWAPPHDSWFSVECAIDYVGTAGTFQLAHVSELAKWPRQKVSLDSLLQTIPPPTKTYKTAVVIESTANGEGDHFHKMWVEALKHHELYPQDYNTYIPLFYSWLDFPEEYSMPVENWYRFGTYTKEEQELLALPVPATLEQLRWRRWAIKESCGGSVETFKQEYPSCWTESFLSSGDHAIPAETRKQHRKTVEAPKYARLEWCDKAKTLTRLVPCDYDANGCWRIWEEPKPAHDYAAGGDVSEGLPIDPSDIHGKRDRSAMVVLNRRYLRTAAMWVGTMDPDLFGEEMVKAGRYWNNAWIAPEVNNAGQSTLDRIRQMGYPKLYQRQRDADEINLTPRSLLGWRTTATTRDYLIDRYLEACRENPDREIGWLMSFVNLSSELADEEDTFIRKEKKREHRDGARDDILFAAMIAVEVHRTCPRECVYPQYAETMEEVRLGSEFMGGYKNGTFHHGGMTVVTYKSS